MSFHRLKEEHVRPEFSHPFLTTVNQAFLFLFYCCKRRNCSHSSQSMLSPVAIVALTERYTLISTAVIVFMGLIGNVLIILVFKKLKIFRNNQCAFYFIFESAVNIPLLIYNFILRLITVRHGFNIWYLSPIWCKLRIIIGQTLVLVLFSTICFTAFDQFLATSYCVSFRNRSSMNLARRLVLVGISLSLCHSIAFGAFFEAKPPGDCAAAYPVLNRYYSYFFYPILAGLIPIMIASCFSLLAYSNVRRIIRRQIPLVRRRLDQQLTKLVLLRVVLLIIFNTPFVIYRIYSINISIHPTDSMRIAIERLVQAFANSLLYLNYTVICACVCVISDNHT